MCMVEICNRETLQSKVNICKSDVKIGDYADSLNNYSKFIINMILNCTCVKSKHNYICVITDQSAMTTVLY